MVRKGFLNELIRPHFYALKSCTACFHRYIRIRMSVLLEKRSGAVHPVANGTPAMGLRRPLKHPGINHDSSCGRRRQNNCCRGTMSSSALQIRENRFLLLCLYVSVISSFLFPCKMNIDTVASHSNRGDKLSDAKRLTFGTWFLESGDSYLGDFSNCKQVSLLCMFAISQNSEVLLSYKAYFHKF